MFDFDLNRRLAAEFIGTAMLLAVVVGSGIMAENLAGGNVAIALLGNTIATGAIPVVLILIFGSISGAHFNPAVTFAFLLRREIGKPDAAAYVTVQVGGGVAGVLVAHLMFDEPLLMLGGTERTGIGQWTGEAVATFGVVGAERYRIATRDSLIINQRPSRYAIEGYRDSARCRASSADRDRCSAAPEGSRRR